MPFRARSLARSLPFVALLAACSPADGGRTPGASHEGVTVALASPVGEVAEGDRLLVWHAAPGITRYEVILSDSVETPIFRTFTTDTQVVLPDGFRYSLTQNYRWYVTAFRDTDSTAWRSPIAVYRLKGEGRRMPPRPAP